MLLQLNPQIPLLTPKGEGLAILVKDDGPESNLEWTVIQQNGEIWTWQNPQVRGTKNITFNRTEISPIK